MGVGEAWVATGELVGEADAEAGLDVASGLAVGELASVGDAGVQDTVGPPPKGSTENCRLWNSVG